MKRSIVCMFSIKNLVPLTHFSSPCITDGGEKAVEKMLAVGIVVLDPYLQHLFCVP